MLDTTLWHVWDKREASAVVGCVFTSSATLCFGQPKARWKTLNDVGNPGRVASIEVGPLIPPIEIKASGVNIPHALRIPGVLLTAGDQYMRYFPDTESGDLHSFEMSRQ